MASIFITLVYKRDILESRLRELAYLNKGMQHYVIDDRGNRTKTANSYTKTFFSEGGITEFVEMLDSNAGRNPLIPKPIFVEGA